MSTAGPPSTTNDSSIHPASEQNGNKIPAPRDGTNIQPLPLFHSLKELDGSATTNGNLHTRVAGDEHGAIGKPRNKRPGSRHSTGFLLESLSQLSHKKRRETTSFDAPTNDPSTMPSTQGLRPPKTPSPTPSTTQNSQRAASSQGGSSRASASDQISMVANGDVHPSLHPRSKGKERASPRVSEGTTWSMTPPRDSFGMDGTNTNIGKSDIRPSHPMDPSALVQMALNLSQSRRMNLAPGQLATVGSPNARRVVSAGNNPPTPTWQGNYAQSGGSIRQKPAQSNASDAVATGAASAPNNAEATQPSFIQLQPQMLSTPYTFSVATLARAEKARIFFELSIEYRRLLQFLPPLKPRARLATGEGLGRRYNPLQYIRNKQVRARERQLIDVEAAGWNSIERVGIWVDTCETDAHEPGFWSGDVARLPRWTQPGRRRASSAASTTLSEGSPADIKTLRWAKIDWSTNPAQLLADAYWLEQDSHKTFIERSNGERLFEQFEQPHMAAIAEDRLLFGDIEDRPQSPSTDSPSTVSGRRRSVSPRSPTEEELDMSNMGFSPLAHHHKRRQVRRPRILRRRKGRSDEFTDSSASDEDHTVSLGDKGSPQFDNTGPLERQMQKMIEQESRRTTLDTLEETSPLEQGDTHGRRGGVSNDHSRSTDSRPTRRDSRDVERHPPSRKDTRDNSTPRISIDDYDSSVGTSRNPDGENHSRRNSVTANTKRRRRGSRLNFFHKHDVENDDNNIETTDFAFKNIDVKKLSPIEPPRRSLETARSNSTKSLILQQTRSKSGDDTQSDTGKFFKGGRLGDVVRKERPKIGDFIKRVSRNEPISTSDPEDRRGSTAVSDSDDDAAHEPLSRRKSRSAVDLRREYYSVGELPTFRSTRAKDQEQAKVGVAGRDHITQQTQAQRDRKRSSRFQEHPLALQTSNDVSPNSSQQDLTLFTSQNQRGRGSARDRSGQYLGPAQRREDSRSRSPAVNAGRRLNEALLGPGTAGPDTGLPVTALGRLRDQRREKTAQSGKPNSQIPLITTKDIAYVRAILTLTGVKASTIVRRANEVRDPVPAYLAKAAALSQASLAPVTRRQEHVLAARLLSQTLEESLAAVTEDAHRFRNDARNKLHARLDGLRELMTAKLMPAVRSAGDEADAFVAQLTTTHTLSVKQVNDSVDMMMRHRRRRLRLMRNAGFKGLEWVVVGLLWVVWLVVSVLKVVRAAVMGVMRSVRWAVWS